MKSKYLFGLLITFSLVIATALLLVLVSNVVALTYNVDPGCINCHSYGFLYKPYNHDTIFDSNQWPNLDPNCQQSSCHEIVLIEATGNPNLWPQHLYKTTTNFPSTNCGTCHHGLVVGGPPKMGWSVVSNAIYQNNTQCKACHSPNLIDHEPRHNTDYIDSPPVKCAKCHTMISQKTGSPNLWTWHLDRITTSYSSGMDCQSCHNYSGTKLSKSDIDNAIKTLNTTRCQACHQSSMHNLDPNPDHRTNFLGDATACSKTGCHMPSREAKDLEPNLQDFHVQKITTSYQTGMDCNSCHDYFGGKLDANAIDSAIAQGGYSGTPNTRCDGCHSITTAGHEPIHNTKYDSDMQSPTCDKCHPAKSTTPGNEGNANLWVWHLNRSTTTYPEGMDCQSCHNYSGSKLLKTNIVNAISVGDTDCKACHTIHSNVGVSHDTSWADSKPVECSSCHISLWTPSGNDNLWPIHLGQKTTSFSFMDCDSCHNYNENYLNKDSVKNAVWSSDTRCDACHASLHNYEISPQHRTNFEGDPNSCTNCHSPSRIPVDSTHNLQDLHLSKQTTSYPSGITCNNCHNYEGAKLSKVTIDAAIARGGLSGNNPSTKCSACHTNFDLTSDHAKPNAPTMGQPEVTQNSIKWNFTDNSNNEAGFKLHDENHNAVLTSSTPDLSSIEETNLTANSRYSRHVHAYNSAGDSDASNTTSIYTLSADINISANKNISTWYNTSDIAFTNEASFGSGGIEFYRYVWNQDSTHGFSDSEAQWVNGVLNQAATAVGEWYLHLKSFNGDGVGSETKTYGPYYFDDVPPTEPSNLVLSAVSPSQIDLTWNSSTESGSGLAGYKIERALDNNGTPANFIQIDTTIITSYSDTNLLPNTKYWYRVIAHDNASNNGNYSQSMSKTTLSDPPGVVFASDGTLNNQIEVSWLPSITADHYHVYKDGPSGIGTLIYDSNGTSFIDNVSDSSEHTYYVYSVNSEDAESYQSASDIGYALLKPVIVAADQVLHVTKLKSYTDDDNLGLLTDVTYGMKDNDLSDSYDLMVKKGDNRALAIRLNNDATLYSKILVRFYITNIQNPPDNSRVYAYRSDANQLDLSSYINYDVSNIGWNEVDVTNLATKMQGFGWMKFRLLTIDQKHRVAETALKLER